MGKQILTKMASSTTGSSVALSIKCNGNTATKTKTQSSMHLPSITFYIQFQLKPVTDILFRPCLSFSFQNYVHISFHFHIYIYGCCALSAQSGTKCSFHTGFTGRHLYVEIVRENKLGQIPCWIIFSNLYWK